MHISVSVIRSDKAPNGDEDLPFYNFEVFEDMTINDLKAMVEDDAQVQKESQHYFVNNAPVADTSRTFEQLNVKEGDLLGLVIQDPNAVRQRQPPQAEGQRLAQRPRQGPDPEQLRLHMAGDPRVLAQVRQSDPDLAAAANDRERFHALWDERQRQAAQAQAEKEAQLVLLNADPFNPETQAKIEELIRQERVAENVQKALDENPESFGRVTMLYIDCLVNNTPIKAFVDSGAQTTIMSPDAAARCNISRLIDTRFGGIARGVGTAKILGRVHSAEIQIGQYNLPSSFTVMEGKDVDLLLGLDMLKRHQMCIDLRKNSLIIQADEIPFLSEREIPKMYEEMIENEPKVKGPAGTQVGTKTGTVVEADKTNSAPSSSQAGSSASSSSSIRIHPRGTVGSVSTPASQPAQQPPSQPPQNPTSQSQPQPQPQQRQFGFGQQHTVSEASIAQITDMGFSRQEALQALEAAGGNVEVALAMLL